VCNDAVPDLSVVTRLWIEQSKFQVSARTRGFFFCRKTATSSGANPSSYSVSTGSFSQRYDFRGVKPTSGLYCTMCLHGRSQTTSRCFTKMPYQEMPSAVPRLSVGRAGSGKESLTFRSLCPLGRAPVCVTNMKTTCGLWRRGNCELQLTVSDGP
jgi:hypothetical protein